jgi:hypothetical protein
VVGNLIPGGGMTHLQYVNIKFLLLCFEEMSGLGINFDKSEVKILGYSPRD